MILDLFSDIPVYDAIALTRGSLVNSPFVNSFENIVFDIKALKRGDLFIAFDEGLIQEAIFHGAYGVIFDKPTQISDTEIAWIKVDCVEEALKKLLRFYIIENKIQAYSCDEITYKLALQTMTDQTFTPLGGKLKEIAKTIWNLKQNSTVLFCPKFCDKSLFAHIKDLPKNSIETIEIKEQTLFETSFVYDSLYYEREQISPIFLPQLESLLNLYKELHVQFRLKRFTPLPHFKPVFVNKKIEIKEFGTSDKVVIFEPKKELFFSELKFLQKYATWGKKIFIVPKNTPCPKDNKGFLFYDNKEDILKYLQTNNFNFALVVGVDSTLLDNYNTKTTQLTLF